MDSRDISEYMAYDLTENRDWLEKQKKANEAEESRRQGEEARMQQVMQLFGFKG